MSSSLVRKALELYDGDLTSATTSKKRNFQTADGDDGVKKFYSKKGNKKKRNLVEKFREKQNVKYTEKNLHLLQNIAERKESSSEMLRKIILKSGMCNSQKLTNKQKKRPKPKTTNTAFDEKDFQKFEKEYFS